MGRVFRWLGGVLLTAIVALAIIIVIDIVNHRASTPEAIATILENADPTERALPEARIEQLLAVEDPTFFERNGIDLATPGQGLTTIGQGLGKRIYFDPFRPGWRKIRLMYLTRFAMFPTTSHQDILAAFVAGAYLGNSEGQAVIGFAQGAQTWFGSTLDTLDDDAYLGLVAMLIGPNALRPTSERAAHDQRLARIKKLLAEDCAPNGLRDVWLEGCA